MILDPHGRPIPEAPRRAFAMRRVRATYDAAQPGGTLGKHWTAADNLSPNLATNPAARRTLRSRARYEVANNSYAAGVVSTLANYVIGGLAPRLRLFGPNSLGVRAQKTLLDLSRRFNDWAWEVELAAALHTMQRAKSTDGEGCLLLVNRRTAARTAVSLGLRTFEAEMISNPKDTVYSLEDKPEGIDVGSDGCPQAYWILKRHPGSGASAVYGADATRIPAGYVCHWYDELRPGMMRGVPEITPALSMFAQLRRYTAAVINTAEAAASFSGVLETTTPPGEADKVEVGSTFEVDGNQFVSLPDGWTLKQVKAEHPGPQHETFIRCIVREIGRCVDMPLAVAAMDASGHNYSSMRGDWQAFFAAIAQRRAKCEHQVLGKILSAWLSEALLVYDVELPDEYDYAWDWSSWEPIDAQKDAAAAQARLDNRLTSYAREFGRLGLNWRDEFAQIAVEEAEMRELGIARPAIAPAAGAGKPGDGEDDKGGDNADHG